MAEPVYLSEPGAKLPAPDAVLEKARERLSAAIDADRDNREEGLDDLLHIAGVGQWDEEERLARDSAGRPCLTINLLPQFVRNVTGDIRRMNPAINVMAADGDASEEVAEVYEGLVRHIEQSSDASAVYEGAAESAAQCGMGAFRILTEYEDDAGFEQRIVIRRIHNAFSVHWDPVAREATRSDARFCFIVEELEPDEFKRLYPKAKPVDVSATDDATRLRDWINGERIVVAEYFWKEVERVTLSLMTDGSIVEGKQNGALRERECDRETVMWAKLSGEEVLEGPRPFPSKFIPVVAVMGEELHLGERIHRSSVIRFAKDPQRLYNYWSSAQAEVIALQPKAPFLVTPNQVKNLEDMWGQANDSNRPYLVYNHDDKAGPPQRATPPVPSSAIMSEIQKAREDMKATTGIYDAGLGARSSETSGIAIRQRQMESDVSTSVYADNMGKAISQAGRILVDMIPRIYDTPRTVRIVGKDDVEKMVQVNIEAQNLATGETVLVNPLTRGRYDVRVTVGPNYATRRQETAEGMIRFLQAVPQAAAVTGDLIAKAMDWPDADAIAERLAKTLPPMLRDPESLTPEEQAQMQQAMQMQATQAQAAQAAAQADLRLKVASAAEKEAKAQAAGIEARAALMEAQRPEAQGAGPTSLDVSEALARIREIVARVELIGAQTDKTRAETLRTTVQALTPPVPPRAPTEAPAPRAM